MKALVQVTPSNQALLSGLHRAAGNDKAFAKTQTLPSVPPASPKRLPKLSSIGSTYRLLHFRLLSIQALHPALPPLMSSCVLDSRHLSLPAGCQSFGSAGGEASLDFKSHLFLVSFEPKSFCAYLLVRNNSFPKIQQIQKLLQLMCERRTCAKLADSLRKYPPHLHSVPGGASCVRIWHGIRSAVKQRSPKKGRTAQEEKMADMLTRFPEYF